jgi:mono/diheme cytochrome c family protein
MKGLSLRATRRLGLVLTMVSAAALGAAGCGEDDPVPAQPTWVSDVEPILRANCFSCHGASADTLGRHRFDVYDLDSYSTAGAFTDLDVVGGKMEAPLILSYATDPNDNTRMPPPPAPRLSDRDIEILRRWAAAKPPARGRRDYDHPPDAWSTVEPRWMADKLAVTIQVHDDDHEVVLGQLSAGSSPATRILRPGYQTLLLDAAVPTGTIINALITDGWVTLTLPVDQVPARD